MTACGRTSWGLEGRTECLGHGHVWPSPREASARDRHYDAEADSFAESALEARGQDVTVTRGRTSDNAANLAPTFLTQIVNRYAGPGLAGKSSTPNCSRTRPARYGRVRRSKPAESSASRFRRSAALSWPIDPAVSNNETSDETGLVVAGLAYG